MNEPRYEWVLDNLALIEDDLESCKSNIDFCKCWLGHAESDDIYNVLSDDTKESFKQKLFEIEVSVAQANRLLEIMQVKASFAMEKELLGR